MTIPMWCSTSSIVRSNSSRSASSRSAELVDLAVAEAARRLVEQQQPRPRAQRARQLDALERAVGQADGGPVGDVGELEARERVVGLLAQLALGAARRRAARARGDERAAAGVVRAEHHVLAHGQRAGRARGSGTCARCPSGAISCGARASRSSPVERDRARVGRRTSRLMQLNSVVLPAPLGPISPQISPLATSNVGPSRATTPPKRTTTSLTDSNSGPLLVAGG